MDRRERCEADGNGVASVKQTSRSRTASNTGSWGRSSKRGDESNIVSLSGCFFCGI